MAATAAPGLLPRGRSSLPRADVRAAQRERLLRATVEAIAELGYRRTTVADIVARARVSREAFYAQWATKDGCFEAAFDAVRTRLDTAMREAVAALPRGAAPEERLRATIAAYLATCAADPAATRCFMVEYLAAVPGVLEARNAHFAELAGRLHRWHRTARRRRRDWPRRSRDVALGMVGAMNELILARVCEDRVAELAKLEAPIMEILLGVYAGAER